MAWPPDMVRGSVREIWIHRHLQTHIGERTFVLTERRSGATLRAMAPLRPLRETPRVT